MKLRVLVVAPYEAMRESLAMFVESLGHDAVAVEAPEQCLHYLTAEQRCDREAACCDALILAQQLPAMRGIDFVDRLRRGGCQLSAASVAMICAPWSDKDCQRAEAMGFQIFEMPLKLTAIAAWLEQVATNTLVESYLPLSNE